jgi:4-amino-4-deoxy-L-arabinose transferase-like glycosyltransferase
MFPWVVLNSDGTGARGGMQASSALAGAADIRVSSRPHGGPSTGRGANYMSKARAPVAIAIVAGVLALGVRWYFATHAEVLQPLSRDPFWGDAGQYYRYALNIFHHGVFSLTPPGAGAPVPDSFRDPGYPAFLALGMALTHSYNQWYSLVILSQVVLGGITVACATLAIRGVLSNGLLAVAAGAMALWPHLVSTPAYVLSESLTAVFCATAALALREAADRRSSIWAAAGGLSLAIAALTNGVLSPLVVILALVFVWKRTLPRRALWTFALVTAVPLFAWGLRNAGISSTLSPAMRAEINFVQGSWPTYHAAGQLAGANDPVGIQTIDAINAEIANLHADHAKGLLEITARMRRSPGTYLTWYLGKPALLWGWSIGLGSGDIYMYPTHNSPFVTQPVMRAIEAVAFIFNGVLAALALVGAILVAMQREPPAGMLVFAVTAAWVTIAYAVFQSDARYSTPFRPAEIALACLATSIMFARLRQRMAKRS